MRLVQYRMFDWYLSGCSIGAMLDVRLVLVCLWGWCNIGCSIGTCLDVRLVLCWMLGWYLFGLRLVQYRMFGWYLSGCSIGAMLDVKFNFSAFKSQKGRPVPIQDLLLKPQMLNKTGTNLRTRDRPIVRPFLQTKYKQNTTRTRIHPSRVMTIESRHRFRTVDDRRPSNLQSLLEISCMAYRGSLWSIAATEWIWNSERNNRRLVTKLGHCSRSTAFPKGSEESCSPANSVPCSNVWRNAQIFVMD